jgi:hypothetical protein
MATFRDIVKEQRKQGKGIGSSLKTAFSERAKEKIDPRNYLFKKDSALTALFPSLGGYKAKTGAEKLKSDESKGFSDSAEQILNSIDRSLNLLKSQMKMVAKNSIVLPQMARDTNITRQNIQKLVKSLGVKPTYDNDMFFQNAQKRESQYQSKVKESKPTKEKKVEEKEKKGFFATLLETIQDFIGPIINMIKGIVETFVSSIATAGRALGFLALLLGPEAALVAGFVAFAAALVYLADLIPKPSAESLAAIKSTQDKYWKDIYNKNPDAVPKAQREQIEKEMKEKGGVITEKIEPVSSSDVPKPTSKSVVFKQDVPDGFFQSKLAKEKKEGGGKGDTEAGLTIGQALISKMFGYEQPKGASASGPVPAPGSSTSMNFPITPTKAEPFTKDLSSIVPFRSKNNDVSAFKHREGIDLAVQSIITKGLGGSTIDAVTGLNDKFHHEEKQGSLHTMGLAADFGLSKNTTQSDINDTVVRIQADLAKAGLQPNEYLVQGEKKGDGGATAPHIHLEFKNKDAAAKYAEYAKKTYDLSPSRFALNENKVPSKSDMDKAAAAADPASLSKGGSTAAVKAADNRAAPAISIEYERNRLKEQQEKIRLLEEEIKNSEKAKTSPVSVYNDNRQNTTNGGSGAPMLATADVYNNALEWYMSKMA